MKKFEITLAERIFAVVLAIALIVGLVPDTLLLVTAETGSDTGTYTLMVRDEAGRPISGAKVSWEICDADGNHAVPQEEKTSGEDGICKMDEINTAFSEDGNETVCFRITDVTAFGYTYTDMSQSVQTVEKSKQNEQLEISLAEKEKGTLTGKIETADGGAVKNAAVSVSFGNMKPVETNEEGMYTIEGLYIGETYKVSVSHEEYISPEPQDVTIGNGAECNFKMNKKIEDSSFAFSDLTPDNIVYGENPDYENWIDNKTEEIKYTIVEELTADGLPAEAAGTVATINETLGILTINTAGIVTVRATNSDHIAEHTLTIERAGQSEISFDESNLKSIEHDGTLYDLTSWKIAGGSETAEVEYAIAPADSQVAVIENGKIVTKGKGKFTLSAKRKQTACYKESNTVSCEIQVTLPEQKEIKIVDRIASEMVYSPAPDNEPLDIENTDGSAMENSGVRIIYKIESADGSDVVGTDVAGFYRDGQVLSGDSVTITVGENSGGVYIQTKKAGRFRIVATKEKDGYEQISAYKDITVERADRNYSWNTDEEEIIYGSAEYEVKKVKDGEQNEVDDIIYKIKGNTENELGAKLENGTITFQDNKVGTITIIACIGEDDCYNAWEREYQLTVKYLEAPDPAYKLENADKVDVGEVSWYKATDSDGVKIMPPDGFKISSNNNLRGNTWSDYIVYNSKLDKIYLKKEDEDQITDGIVLTEKIDVKKPIDLSIRYQSESGNSFYHKNSVTVTLSAKDEDSGIESFVYNLGIGTGDVEVASDTRGAAEFEIPAQYAGKISFKAIDKVGNEAEYVSTNFLIVDNLAPKVTISYSKDGLRMVNESNHTVEKADANTRFIYNQTVKARIRIEEANFDADIVKVKINNKEKELRWEQEKGVWIGTFDLTADGSYEVEVECADKSGNIMEWTSNEGEGCSGQGTYRSHRLMIDTIKPKMAVSYDTAKATKGNYYKTARTATITITEANFDVSGVDVRITAEDISGKNLKSTAKLSGWSHEGSVHKATVTFPGNAVYTFDISSEDIAGNKADNYKQDKFVVDRSKPTDLCITYSKKLNTWKEILNKITFGYYTYKKDVVVKIEAKDNISGIDKMKWTYNQEDETSISKNVKKKEGTISGSAIKYSKDGVTATATFKLTATEAEQFRGHISFTATDRAGNTSAAKKDSERINIVDTISPKRKVTFTPAKQVVDAKTMKTKSNYKYDSEGTNSILYYDGPVKATFQITEANFYAKDVVIQVNGKKKTPKNWKQDGDTWTGSIKISGDGEYVVTMTYKDRSNNQMKKYTSEKIVIDTKDPVIKVSYSNKDSKNTVNGIKYFDDVQTATIKIQERNFRAKDVKATVTAKDVSGNDVEVMNYTSYLSNKNNWKKNENTYTAKIMYTADANYTFDITYQDLATRAAADYKQDSFAVDKSAPENLTVSYSTSVAEKILNAITFGYYNAQVTVTVTAEDATSGIEHFKYSYRKDSGVSSVNAELIDAAIQNADVVQNGNTFTASFRIPEQALENANQFNGTVDFTAYDYAENNSAKADDKRIVVDNIKPVADVTFSDPVREVNNISYYAGDISATVVIHEANFDAADVIVSVSKDGAPVAVTPTWQDDGTDIHTGTFTLHEDGDYIVTVDYTDASLNEMDSYVSNQLTIDTEAPSVSVSNVKMNSANKDEVYSFTITASDINFDMANFKPALTALIQNAQGKYVTETIDLGTMKVSEAGKTYSYSISNLAADAVYKLVCTVSDLAGNEYSKILLNEDHTEYDAVSFSINRNGSAYAVDEDVETLVNQYYVYSVNNDIVIEEVNVDPIENYTVKMNGENLAEGSDYTTSLSANEGEWCKRTYTIKKELFDAEGEYNVVVESTDKTNTTAYSDVKNLNVAFVVDQTAPVLTVSGLEDSGRYQVQEQTVTVIPTDDGGKLESFQAVVLDADGNPIRDAEGKDNSVRFEMSGEEFEKYLEENNGTITFTIPEGLERQVLLACNDMALHTDGTTNECKEVFTKVTVSQSGWVILYANKPLLYSMISGIAVLILAAGTVIVLVRKKKVKRA